MSDKTERMAVQTETCGAFTFFFCRTPAGAVIGNNGDCAVTPKPMEELVLPVELGGLRVVGIAPHAFAGCGELEQITLPKWLDFISEKAFMRCSSLECVLCSEIITEIGESAFEGCGCLSAFKLPRRLRRIGARAFAGCSQLPVIKFCDDLAEIGEEAFSECHALSTIFFAETALSLGSQVFKDTAWWKKQPPGPVYAGRTLCGLKGDAGSAVFVREGTLSVAEETFTDCGKLRKVVLPASLESIAPGAFCGCPLLTKIEVSEANPKFKSSSGALYSSNGKELILCPGGKTRFDVAEGTEIIRSAFLDCNALKELVFPKGVLRLEPGALCGAVSVAEIILPEGVRLIGDEAFEQCVSAKRVVLPETLVEIGRRVFSDMENLESIAVVPGNRFYKSVHGALFSMDGARLIAAPRQAVTFAVPDGTRILAAGAFEKCVRLRQVMLPNALEIIEASAFEGCTELQELILPEELREIGPYAFRGCAGIERFAVSEKNSFFLSREGVLYSGDGLVLLMCPPRLTVFTPHANIRRIADFAFEGCTGITQLEFGGELEFIGEGAFRGCRGLKSVGFLGNAPACGGGIYEGVCTGFMTVVHDESKGWNGLHNSTALPQAWCGFPIRRR